ncbi:MAG: heme ABC transporter ATP-binding protein [Hydrogenophaga sp.]|uniref:heme ABC transporter ATP-binding protein n=1 Tax=Hydrogenophaga sp. TaxID=1904254 RepID=UPI002718AD70|nr:heme ABC transporter ATP-binding protein [Hydrogenophaga sp.]MDO9568023.1 heme ABC transporter ATP-binding protein [Hydrogenophaga sp.]MDP3926054.1 heme ABC transporter ATP-binding protein [Hydrogenophaga sp.]
MHTLPMAQAEAASGRGLSARGITVRAARTVLLHGISLHLPAGEVGVLLGPNGAGKSTLLSVLAGLRMPDAGQVWLDGQPMALVDMGAQARCRALLAQDSSVAFDFLACELVGMGRYPHRLQPSADEAGIALRAMAAADVGHLAHRSVQSLSGGERARVQLARALAQVWEARPDGASRWLLLDEPTAALDLRHQHETLATVRRWAREQGVGVLAVLHDLNLALRYADRVWVLDQGRLQASGAPAQVLTPELLHRVWQVHAQPVVDADGCAQLLTQALPQRLSQVGLAH